MKVDLAIITGAASGIGQACAERFVDEGWIVAALDQNRDRLAALGAQLGDGLLGFPVDITDSQAVDRAVRQACERAGAPRACVNAAGIYPPTTLDTATAETFGRIFDVNVLGTVLVTKSVVERMRYGREGAIVNIASVDAFAPPGGQLLYSASKAAVVSLTRSLAVELAPQIRVNALAPGWVDTEGNRKTGRMVGAEGTIPLGRVARPAEIADMAWLLAGEERGSYVTGETLVVSGGLVIR